MTPPDSFSALMARLKSGEDAAARAVFERYAARLIGLARQSLSARLQQKEDPEDIVQSAYKSFFVRHREADWSIDGWDGLWGMLTLITVRKCADRAERFTTEMRDLNRERAAPVDSGGFPLDFASDREPSPYEAAVLAETVESLFAGIDDGDERSILEMSLQGYSTAEICDQTGRAERSVRRLRERTRRRLERLHHGE